MILPFANPANEEVWQIVKEINDSWVTGQPENLDSFFHERLFSSRRASPNESKDERPA